MSTYSVNKQISIQILTFQEEPEGKKLVHQSAVFKNQMPIGVISQAQKENRVVSSNGNKSSLKNKSGSYRSDEVYYRGVEDELDANGRLKNNNKKNAEGKSTNDRSEKNQENLE